YTTSGIKTGPTANCVTEKLDLTITPSSDNVTIVSACDSYFWNGTTYTTSGIKTGPTANCVTEKLDLTITPSSDNVTTVSACNSYFWNGTTYTTSGIKTGPTLNCITEKLDLTITPSSDNVTIVSTCDSYTWNGTTYTTSGIKTGPTANCVTEKLDLTINTTTAPTGLASQTFCSSETVSLLNATGTGIIWYDAATLGAVVTGSTLLVDGTTYYASQTISGCESSTRLAVTVTAGGCLGLDNFDAANLLWYPNPTKGILNITYSKNIEEISVINLLGQTLFTNKTKANEVHLDLSKLSTDTYFVKVVSEGKSKMIKVIKQ
uniref:T9SS type A sorting domain-containing protein n=1 Tax=Flavobacterium sp. TaxID=239 RepID=UPI00374FE589